MNVFFETFGCRLNRAEALDQEAAFLAKGWTRVETPDRADMIVVRGCSVTRRAQHDCEKRIAHLRRHFPATPLKVFGCLPEATRPDKSLADAPEATTRVPVRTARAYLKCQDGCGGACSFCIVPRFRGPSQSVPFERVLARASQFIEAGYHEIVLTGCNLSLYASQGQRLPQLLDALAALSPSCRIRLGSLEPSSCAREVVDVLAVRTNVCRFLHIPVQSGSDAVLRTMKRPYRAGDVEEFVRLARAHVPRLALGCDVITGFPGETDLDFIATKGLLKRLQFVQAHVFPYSERPGTLAALLPNAIPREVRHARAHELAASAQEIRRRDAPRFVGEKVEVLIEDEKKGEGWTGEYFTCRVAARAGERLARKSLVTAVVERVEGDKLVARKFVV